MKSHLLQQDKIVEGQDIDALFSLKENSDFSIALHQILMYAYNEASLQSSGQTWVIPDSVTW